jgi:hypothetical protein
LLKSADGIPTDDDVEPTLPGVALGVVDVATIGKNTIVAITKLSDEKQMIDIKNNFLFKNKNKNLNSSFNIYKVFSTSIKSKHEHRVI